MLECDGVLDFRGITLNFGLDREGPLGETGRTITRSPSDVVEVGGTVSGSLEFTMGMDVRCSNAAAGTLSRVLLNPAGWTVSHVVVEPKSLGNGRLVPVRLIETTQDQMVLSCTSAQFDNDLIAADDRLFDAVIEAGDAVTSDHVIPKGTIEIVRHETIQVNDGQAGTLRSLIADSNLRITAVVVNLGHVLHRREVSIPADQFTGVDEFGMHLSITRGALERLHALP